MDEQYLNYESAVKKFFFLLKERKKIFGIERFFITPDGSIIPDMEGITDYSDASVEESLKAAAIFLRQYGKEADERFIFVE